MRRKRRRHKAVDDAVPDLAFVGDARSLARDVVNKLCCSNCKGGLKPAAPVKPKGSMSLTLRFECGSCDADICVRTGDKVRLYKQPEALPKEFDSDEEADEPKRSRGRGRDVATTRAVVGALFSGQNYSNFQNGCVAQNLSTPHEDTFKDYIDYFAPHIEYVTHMSVRLVRFLVSMIDEGEYLERGLLVTSDSFWAARGHYAMHATGTICDFRCGGILAFCHQHKQADKAHPEIFEGTSGAMDAIGFAENHKSVCKWIEALNAAYDDDATWRGANYRGVILDGDGSTQAQLDAMGPEWIPAGFIGFQCANHLAKNVGKKSYEVGHRLHLTCSCEVKKKANGEAYAKGARVHRGCNDASHPLVKAWQRGFGGALRSVLKRRADDEAAGRAPRSLQAHAVEAVEMCFNHLKDEHDGPGFLTGERIACSLHDLPHTSTTYNDCPDYLEEMSKYLHANFFEKLETTISEDYGPVTQNSSERVGSVAIGFRDKDHHLLPTHYEVATNLAILQANQVVINCFAAAQLEDEGELWPRVERWQTYQYQICHSIGLTPTQPQLDAWSQAAMRRAKQSVRRKTEHFKKQRAQWRKDLTEKRKGERKDSKATYKQSKPSFVDTIVNTLSCCFASRRQAHDHLSSRFEVQFGALGDCADTKANKKCFKKT